MELNQSEKMLFALLCSALNTIPVNSALLPMCHCYLGRVAISWQWNRG